MIPSVVSQEVWRMVKSSADDCKSVGFSNFSFGGLLQGMDELTPMGSADVVEATPDHVKRYTLEPNDLGIPRCALHSLHFDCDLLTPLF